MGTSNEKRKEYIVIFRALATIAVVFYHCGAGGSERLDNFVKVIFNWCVPIFLMITGALFLDSQKELTEKIVCSKYVPKFLCVLAIGGISITYFLLLLLRGHQYHRQSRLCLWLSKEIRHTAISFGTYTL